MYAKRLKALLQSKDGRDCLIKKQDVFEFVVVEGDFVIVKTMGLREIML